MNLDSILKDYMTTVEAGKLYGVHSRTIRDLIYTNKVDFIKVDWPQAPHVGFKYMVNKKSLENHFNPGVEKSPVEEYIQDRPPKLEPVSKLSKFKSWLIGLLSK